MKTESEKAKLTFPTQTDNIITVSLNNVNWFYCDGAAWCGQFEMWIVTVEPNCHRWFWFEL